METLDPITQEDSNLKKESSETPVSVTPDSNSVKFVTKKKDAAPVADEVKKMQDLKANLEATMTTPVPSVEKVAENLENMGYTEKVLRQVWGSIVNGSINPELLGAYSEEQYKAPFRALLAELDGVKAKIQEARRIFKEQTGLDATLENMNKHQKSWSYNMKDTTGADVIRDGRIIKEEGKSTLMKQTLEKGEKADIPTTVLSIRNDSELFMQTLAASLGMTGIRRFDDFVNQYNDQKKFLSPKVDINKKHRMLLKTGVPDVFVASTYTGGKKLVLGKGFIESLFNEKV